MQISLHGCLLHPVTWIQVLWLAKTTPSVAEDLLLALTGKSV